MIICKYVIHIYVNIYSNIGVCANICAYAHKDKLALFQKEFNSTYQNMYIKIKWCNKVQEKKKHK